MSLIFSKKCEYGLQAALYLSRELKARVAPAEEIAQKLAIPKEFVSKILQELTASGIIQSRKGKNGGFALAKPLSKIKLIDIVVAIDGFDIFHSCVLGFKDCSNEEPCPVHKQWAKLRDETFKMLSDETLDQFIQKTQKKIASIARV